MALAAALMAVAGARAQSGLTACVPGGGKDHFPFCNTSLPLDDRVRDLVSRIPDEIKPNLLTARGHEHSVASQQDIPELGVPSYYWGQNCLHSSMFSSCTPEGRCSTSFPSGPSFAATFDRKAMRDMATVIGQETRAGFNTKVMLDNGEEGSGLECWGPVININRDPRWGRNGEGGAEDPFLMGQVGAAWTEGLQIGDGRDPSTIQVLVTLKHYVANDLEGQSLDDKGFNRMNVNVNLSNYLLADEYFPAYRTSIRDAGARGVMCSYNSVNGIPTCLSPLMKAARDAWGFKGYVTSDSDSVECAWSQHHYVKTAAEASCLAVKVGGCDIDSGNTYYDSLLEGVNQSLCTMADVDRAVFNTMRVRFELGLFDPPTTPFWQLGTKDIGTDAATALNYEAACKGLVLVSNPKAVLPLKKGLKIAVIGPHGNESTEIIQRDTGKICPNATGEGRNHFSFDCVLSPYEAIAAANVGGSTTYTQGCDLFEPSIDGFAAALEAAKEADVIVLGLGISETVKTPASDPYLEQEGHDRQSIDLPQVQQKLATALLALGKPTVAFFLNGGSVAFRGDVLEKAAVIEAFYPGMEGSRALADSIFGTVNRWGRMPYTVYPAEWADKNSMFDFDVTHKRTYRYGADALVAFGTGMSYTTFSLDITSPHVPEGFSLKTDGSSGNLTVVVSATNAGAVGGDVVIQLYLHPIDVPSISVHPNKTLVDFARLDDIAAGESAEATFTLSTAELLLVAENGDRVSAPGQYALSFEDGSGQVVARNLQLVGNTVIVDPFPIAPKL
eukprot:CAMPEP_0182919026 /NCGR_PEP_ID=MMETSP0105_2-20130417/2424_1 /TAXON_ID=81532 ORGANISM="Acanthoeca-like sp., Strain 10tr" /NCGR_SAMPLE_ID=MMETSP0105_2 /ASSEMBLY_ACC=CAM_ASM_000205 /LENGTH=784 /DNA_ID=CAMNT_0025056151 /DNA_START=43 /DNA_END=2397 /DNA_ORIENTATION=+